LTPEVCSPEDKFAFIVHGWLSASRTWPQELLKKLQKYRGGCIIIVNWGKFSEETNYAKIVSDYLYGVSAVITSRLQHLEAEGVNPDDIFMYGHSMGGRLVIDAAINFGKGKIGQIDGEQIIETFSVSLKQSFLNEPESISVCDNAALLFKETDKLVDSRDAAKNVQCIHTSAVLGTLACRCHQDWLMGR
jgi:hypothetical protein